MVNLLHFAICLVASGALAVPLFSNEPTGNSPSSALTPTEQIKILTGSWEGTVKTWFMPGKLEDESTVKGRFFPILNGKFLRHEYVGSMKGKSRHGEETIVFNTMTKKFQISWFDDFHMNYGMLFSDGPASDHGFSVIGKYEFGTTVWHWRTAYEILDNDHITVTAYNIKPGEQETKAVETIYHRVPK